MDVEKVTGQHVQGRVVRKIESEGLGVVGICLDMDEFIGTRCLGLDTGDDFHSGEGIVGDHNRQVQCGTALLSSFSVHYLIIVSSRGTLRQNLIST